LKSDKTSIPAKAQSVINVKSFISINPGGTMAARRLFIVGLLHIAILSLCTASFADTVSYSYDDFGRLTYMSNVDAIRITKISYVFDDIGNFTNRSVTVAFFVNMPDANLRAAVCSALGKNPTDPLTSDDMANLTTLSAAGKDITDLTGLEWAVNLTSADLSNNNISSTAALAGLTRLTYLNLDGNPIAPPAVARFSAFPTTGVAPLDVNFTDLSLSADTWSWDFGDGTTSSLQNPLHTYTLPGTYSVGLRAINSSGGTAITKNGLVTVTATAVNAVLIPRTPPVSYPSLQAAFDAAQDGEIIQSQAVQFSEDLVFSQPIAVFLNGGYSADFSTETEITVLTGTLSITNGSVTANKLIIR
jgi:PKD repeat protein